MLLNFKTYLFSLFLLGTQIKVVGQNSLSLGVLPSINFNHKLDKGWGLNGKVENRQQFGAFKSGVWEEMYATDFLDLSLLAVRKVRLNYKLAGGFLVRNLAGAFTYRSIQQLIHNYKFNKYKLTWRLAADQTYSESWVFRARWRNNIFIPLNGEKANQGETYLKFNQETLALFDTEATDLEFRIVPLFGYYFSSSNKLEIGLDYRISDFMQNDSNYNQNLRCSINWYLKLP